MKRFFVYTVFIILSFVAAYYANYMMISPNQADIISYSALAIGVLGVFYNVLKTISIPENKEVFDSGKNCKSDPLNKSGLYRTVKYPALTGDFLMIVSFAMYSAMRLYILIAILLFALLWISDIKKLNKEYEESYGSDYDNWEKRLNAFLPGIFKFRGIGKYSSWKKVNPWYPLLYGLVISALHIYREYTVFQEIEFQDMACVIALLSIVASIFLLVKKGLAKE